ncbi:PLP-dependent aminotransferase family protein [Bifidobacterium sp.]|jgi:2-aminoadipate transaminase|uniref:aminotransferase-like domain-containing protein n=1 Tax=Bifidobacterium sp. TaxID=41200 RepID=UPI0025BC59CA|nr:PLP-dependent aminotransferase family protein [Bifidobacterium sp.]MCH4208812.1 PLP-dependent aminotransferase family protein [Bifidobacterium sp.]MCI1224770.1 PLP-dependent aminotransferase family protein [Bifidobacterium sp.]
MEYRFSKRLAHVTPSVLRENAKKNMSAENTISFAYGFPSTQAFPMDTLREISEKLYTQYNPDTFLQYAPSEGYPILRKLIKERLDERCGIHNDEEVIVVSGSSQAMDLTVKALCDEGDIVLCEEQTFSGAVKAIQSYGAIPMPIPMNIGEQSVDLDALETLLRENDRVKMIYIIPTFQNPLGTSMPLEKRQALYDLAHRYDIIIFEDDPYGDLLYYGEPIAKIKSLDVDERVIYAGSFSKILAPSTRLGFAMAAKPLLDKLVVAKQVADSHSNYYWQVMLTEYMLNYDFEGHVDYLRDIYRERLDAMTEALNKLPADKISYIKPTGGYFIGCTMAGDVDPELFYEALNTCNVAVIPGNIMSVTGEGYEHDFRLNFTRPSVEEIKSGIAFIGQALQAASHPSYQTVS